MTEQIWRPGAFVWRELMTHDVAAAQRFYSKLLGWTYQTMDMPNGPYTMIKQGEAYLGGMMQAPMAEIPAHWNSYISVADVKRAAETVAALGGEVLAGPMDIGPGTFAAVRDPAGAVFTLWRSAQGDGPHSTPEVGMFCWETVTAPDKAVAADFYQQVAGWALDDGPAGPNSFVFAADGTPVADLMVTDQPAAWITYVVVEDAIAARDLAAAEGAKIIAPDIQIPGVGRIVAIQDPTNAYIGLFQGEAPAA